MLVTMNRKIKKYESFKIMAKISNIMRIKRESLALSFKDTGGIPVSLLTLPGPATRFFAVTSGSNGRTCLSPQALFTGAITISAAAHGTDEKKAEKYRGLDDGT